MKINIYLYVFKKYNILSVYIYKNNIELKVKNIFMQV